MKKCLIIPTLNEENSIKQVLARIPHSFDVYVIDGVSTDQTCEIAQHHGAKIILEKRKGKGHAVQTALARLRKRYEIIIMIDGDNTYNPRDAPTFVTELRHADIVFGKRCLRPNTMSFFHRVGNYALSLFASFLYNKKITDLCTGYIGFGKSALSKISISATGFDLEADVFSEAVRNNLRVAEVPISYSTRLSTSKLNAFSDGIKIVRTLIRKRFFSKIG
ncbi:MAG: glycosyltransferase [Candidatus Aenigmarchaeota archaeon]|nr:glycosyltransferase [Candidatus Aenigmarchaeota archaeon]